MKSTMLEIVKQMEALLNTPTAHSANLHVVTIYRDTLVDWRDALKQAAEAEHVTEVWEAGSDWPVNSREVFTSMKAALDAGYPPGRITRVPVTK